MKDNERQDHTKQYRLINGHHVCISFSAEPNPNLFYQVRDILLSCSDTSHICRDNLLDDTIASSKKEAS